MKQNVITLWFSLTSKDIEYLLSDISIKNIRNKNLIKNRPVKQKQLLNTERGRGEKEKEKIEKVCYYYYY